MIGFSGHMTSMTRTRRQWLGLRIGVRFWFRLVFSSRKQTWSHWHSLPALKLLHHSSIGLNCYRSRYQVRRPCILNLSCDHFKQLCLSKGKRAPALLLSHHVAKQTLPTYFAFNAMATKLPTTINLWEILTRCAQFFLYVVVQVIVVHNAYAL